MIDPDILAEHRGEFNYKGKYYNNDHPDKWPYNNPGNLARSGESNVNDDDVYYSLNSHGYRCEEFDKKSELPVVFMGCSHTFGLGLPYGATWCFNLLDKIKQFTNKNIPLWNLAKNGSSIDLQFWSLQKRMHILRPKYIFFLVPDIFRRLTFYQNWAHEILVKDVLPSEVPAPIRKTKNLLADDTFALMESLKYFMLIDGLCKQYNTKVFYQFVNIYPGEHYYDFILKNSSSFSNFNLLNTPWSTLDFKFELDYARDRIHRGPESNRAFAEEVWNEVKSSFE